MWHFTDMASVSDIAKLVFAELKQRVAEDGRHDDQATVYFCDV
jgi:hypothetical protein